MSSEKKEGKIYKKMIDVMDDIGSVGKDQKNTHQSYKFRGIDQFLNHLHPILRKHGVFILPNCVNRKDEFVENSNGKIQHSANLVMQYQFVCSEDGSSVTTVIPSEGLDTSDKATNKALSAALKYALIQTFAVPTEDMEEADKTSPQIGDKKKKSGKSKSEDESEEKKEEKVTSFRKKKKKESDSGGFG